MLKKRLIAFLSVNAHNQKRRRSALSRLETQRAKTLLLKGLIGFKSYTEYSLVKK